MVTSLCLQKLETATHVLPVPSVHVKAKCIKAMHYLLKILKLILNTKKRITKKKERNINAYDLLETLHFSNNDNDQFSGKSGSDSEFLTAYLIQRGVNPFTLKSNKVQWGSVLLHVVSSSSQT